LFTGENFGKQLLKIADPPLTRVNSACPLILSDLEWSLQTNASLSFKIDPQFMKELHHELRALSTRRHQRSAGSGTSHFTQLSRS